MVNIYSGTKQDSSAESAFAVWVDRCDPTGVDEGKNDGSLFAKTKSHGTDHSGEEGEQPAAHVTPDLSCYCLVGGREKRMVERINVMEIKYFILKQW